MEDGRRRVAEAEGVAKKAEEELAVAKERLLLQENELQSKSGTIINQLNHLNIYLLLNKDILKTA